ncbi:hypothetical protein JD844_014916 [Phrynosoma platyrhinos]|uniref:P2X purinoceptor n=1 Tax=Phrynosoma platyrhinos TaxID=52577 RepID=A0ABQ7T6Z0_PHRPL|nr:hypothetical protein JD844_014916 [Phrynosoma platyrhinos]
MPLPKPLATVASLRWRRLFRSRDQQGDGGRSQRERQGEQRLLKSVYGSEADGIDSFFVVTNIIMTENQIQGVCPEFPIAKAVCSTDRSCMEGRMDPQSNGIQTGKCVKYNTTLKTCEVKAWCPVESIKSAPVPATLRSAENFTVLIKNNIHFPKFNYTTRNISPEFNISCTYNKRMAAYCPIFRLGDILQLAGENFSEVAVQGGIIGIEINWDCILDKWLHRCRPTYGFRRLDDKKTNEALYPGYNFRYARYYKQANGKEERTLIKAYGIRFDILVFGTAGQFDFFELLVYIGSALSYFGLHSDKVRSPGNSQELQSLQNKGVTSSSHERPSWCSCGKCRPAQSYWEQLCCRKKDGACITASALFEQLVISRPMLELVLLYKDPLLDLKAETLNKQLRHCAYEQYIHWRFGEDDLKERAMIPSCCRWKIRDAFPSERGEYSGFKRTK